MGQESETAATTEGATSPPIQTMRSAPASTTETLAATPQELSDLFQAPQAPAAPRATPPRATDTVRRGSPTPELGASAPVCRPLDTHLDRRPSLIDTIAPSKRPSVTATLRAPKPPIPPGPAATAETIDGLAFAASVRSEDPDATRDILPASCLLAEEASATGTVFRGSAVSSSLSASADESRTPAALRGSGRPEAPDGVDRNLALARLQERMLGVEPESVKIGRFIVLRKLGQGAMGIVYLAYDPKLDRKVALKLVDTSSLGSEMGEAQVRLEREARAAAALGHPNVVTVYDVGHQGDDVFLAMEFVEGETLTQWMKREHDWREIAALFVQIARGLNAAHEADLVHRDFKPDNVLMGADGRPRVADFGLARPTEGWSVRDAAKMLDDGSSSSSRALALRSSDAMASTGEVCGTPAYMAPEQFVGVDVTGASDQFGFCASLYEALFGHRPFKGDSVTELAVAVIENDRQPLPSKHGVPKAVVQTVLQGLTPEADQRHASMGQLADRLEAALRAQTRNRVLAGGALLAVLGVGFGAQAAVALDEQPCEAAHTDIDSVWSDARRDEVERSLADAALPSGPAARLDAFAAEWTEQRVESCEATRVSGEQSDQVLQLRTACLDRMRARLDAAADALTHAPSADTLDALDGALPTLARCDQVAELMVEASAYEVSGESSLIAEAQWTEASRLMARLALSSTKPPQHWQEDAQALLKIGTNNALASATAHGHLWLGYAEQRKGNTEGARTHYAAGLPPAARTPDRRLLPVLLLRRAEIDLESGDLAAAQAGADLGLALTDRVREQDAHRDLEVSFITTQAAIAYRGDDHERAMELTRGLLEGEPLAARTEEAVRSTLGSACRGVGDVECALNNHTQALELIEGLPNVEPLEVAGRYANLGLLHADAHDGVKAVASLRRAAAIVENASGPNHPMRGQLLSDIGGIEGHLLDPKDGERDLLAGLAVHEHNHGNDGPQLVEALVDLNKTQLRLGKVQEATKHGEWALRIVDASFEGQHPRRADPRLPLADAYASTGRFEDAAALLREGLEILDTPKTHPMQRAEFQFALARALAPSDTEAAREMSETAVASIADFEPGKPLRDAIEGWRAETLDPEASPSAVAQP
ncbi:MAG: protein kinase domain-containing protein [Nannocystales bacterium]